MTLKIFVSLCVFFDLLCEIAIALIYTKYPLSFTKEKRSQ